MTNHSRCFGSQNARALTVFLGSGFLMHLLWENAQMQFFQGFETMPLREHFWICFRATATGDMLFMLTIYLCIATYRGSRYWLTDRTSYADTRVWIIALFVGILLAVGYELIAVMLVQRWQYAASMPLLPVLHVGVLPVFQMMVIPALALLLSRISLQRD